MDSRGSPQWTKGPSLGADQQLGDAEKLARKLEADVDPERDKIESRREFTLREAVETFLDDQKARDEDYLRYLVCTSRIRF
jgi:hypothetical protein